MNKKLFVLLPAALLVLASCNNNPSPTSSSTTGTTTGTTTGSTTGTTTGSTTGTTTQPITSDYGTADSPLSVADFLVNVAKLVPAENEEYSTQEFFVTGYSDGNAVLGGSGYLGNIFLKDSADADKSAKVQRTLLGESGVNNVGKGDKLVVKGFAEYYNGQYSLFGDKGDSEHPNPVLLSSVRGESAITATHDEHCSITSQVPASALNGSEILLTVEAASGYKIDKVVCNGATIANEDGVYHCEVLGPTTINVTSILDIEPIDVEPGLYTVKLNNSNSGLTASSGNARSEVGLKADTATVIYKKLVVDYTKAYNQDNYSEVTIDKGGKMEITTPTGKIKSIKADWYKSQSCLVKNGTSDEEIEGTNASMTGSKGVVKQYAIDDTKAVLTVGQSSTYTQSFYNIEVEIEVTKDVEAISVKTAPKTAYSVGQDFDPTGLVLEVTYKDGDVGDAAYADNPDAFAFDPSTNLQLSHTKVTITYGGKTVELPITVSDSKATSVTVSAAKTTLCLNESTELSAEYNGTHPGTTTYEVVAAGTTGAATISGSTLTATAAGDVYVKAVCSDPVIESEPIKLTVENKSSLQAAYEAAAALAKGASTNEDYTFSGVVTGVKKSQDDIANYTDFFVQDGEYGMYVYKVANTSIPTGFEVGKSVTVTAKLKNYNGTLETGSAPTISVDGDGVLPAPVTVTSLTELNAVKQNVLVNFKYHMPTSLGEWSATRYSRLSGKLGSDTVTLTLEKGVWSAEKAAVYENSADKDVDFTSGFSTGFDSSTGASTANQLFLSEQSTMAINEPVATELVCKASASEVVTNGSVTLSAEFNGSHAAEATFAITEGDSLAILTGNTLTAGNTTGTVKVKAVCTDPVLESEEISIAIVGQIVEPTYTKVTADQTDWAGEYLLVYEPDAETGRVFTGIDAADDYEETTISGASITGVGFVTLTLEKTPDGYLVKVNGGDNDGKYISSSTNNNELKFGEIGAVMTLEYDSDNSTTLIKNEGGAVMRYNSASNQNRFRMYKSSSYANQKPVQLYKLVA